MPTADQVKQLVRDFYHSKDADEQERLHAQIKALVADHQSARRNGLNSR